MKLLLLDTMPAQWPRIPHLQVSIILVSIRTLLHIPLVYKCGKKYHLFRVEYRIIWNSRDFEEIPHYKFTVFTPPSVIQYLYIE